jgi:hypothetical protein
MRAYGTLSDAAGFFVVVALVGCSSALPGSLSGSGGTGASSGAGGLAVTGTGGGPVGGGGSAGSGTGGLSATPAQHRASASVCSGALAEAGVPTEVYDGGPRGPTAPDAGPITCTSDSDCPACSNGQRDRCGTNGEVVSTSECVCDECNSDQDCGPTAVTGFWICATGRCAG